MIQHVSESKSSTKRSSLKSLPASSPLENHPKLALRWSIPYFPHISQICAILLPNLPMFLAVSFGINWNLPYFPEHPHLAMLKTGSAPMERGKSFTSPHQPRGAGPWRPALELTVVIFGQPWGCIGGIAWGILWSNYGEFFWSECRETNGNWTGHNGRESNGD